MGVLGARQLPVFPLPLVLLPGAMLPLHIFEERYKLMIMQCMEADKVFGVTSVSEYDSGVPPLGRVGTMAQIMALVPLEDGKKNILTLGGLRYRTLEYTELKPYLVAEVEIFTDEEESDLEAEMSELKGLYDRASRALKELNGEALPDLPDLPEEFSFAVAGAIRMSDSMKQALLEMVSTRKRLKALTQSLKGVIGQYEHRAEIHSLAKTNGHSTYPVKLELSEE
ncbi:MAG: LON peptidase substrate-binding domain-containing protein [Nitrososphaerota archaeon]